MSYFHPSNKELNQTYGYASQRWDLDATQKEWTDKTDLDWSRPFEIDLKITSGVEQSAEPSIDGITAADAEYFTRGSRRGFQIVARCLMPSAPWMKPVQN